jgi:hypothetical protein
MSAAPSTSPFLTAWSQSVAQERHDTAWLLIRYAKGLDPVRYPSDREWRNHFICKAWEAWKAYRFYRKETI